MLNFENLDKAHFAGTWRYGIPEIAPETEYPKGEFIPVNYAKTEKCPQDKILHFFVDDYQFSRFWNTPDRYIPLLRKFRAVCAPDFSTYTDMPVAMQIYNHYRKHWLAAYWQAHGMTVYPTISWSTPDSYEWCFDGEPEGGIVAVSSVSTQADAESKRLFLQGYQEMLRRLHPAWVIFYGNVPQECDWNTIKIDPYWKKIVQRRVAKWGGRGGSSGGKGGGGGGKAVNAKMPELSGSARQVSWAEQIRHDALANVDSLVSSVNDEFGMSFPGGGRVSSQAANQVKDYIVQGFQNLTSASRIIDNRAQFSFDSLRRAMVTAESQRRRGTL